MSGSEGTHPKCCNVEFLFLKIRIKAGMSMFIRMYAMGDEYMQNVFLGIHKRRGHRLPLAWPPLS